MRKIRLQKKTYLLQLIIKLLREIESKRKDILSKFFDFTN